MSEPRWLNSEEREAWLRIAAVLELLPPALDAQLNRDADLTQFEYYVLAMLSEAPERRLRMSDLAAHTNATLPRLSRVVAGLERNGLVERATCVEDRRATNAELTEAGWQRLVAAAPQHVETVRHYVFDPLQPDDIASILEITSRWLERLDPDGRMLAGTRLASGGRRATGETDDGCPGHPLPRLATPAMRALREAGYETLDDIAGSSARELAALHGIGRSAMGVIRIALDEARLAPLVDD